MSIINSSGGRSVISAVVAVGLTSMLAFTFTSSTAHIRWLGSDAVTQSVLAAQAAPVSSPLAA